jgi:pectate lyase
MKHILTIVILLLSTLTAMAQIAITESGGWYETVYIKWEPFTGATSYNVYYSGNGIANRRIDTQLIRKYASYYRADVVGIAAGDYTIKVVPVVQGVEDLANAVTTTTLTAKVHVREGFAFTNGMVPGAYNLDGTPKSGAIILYVTESTADTITCDVKNNKGVATSYIGIMNILTARGKGYDKTPLIIRFIGTVKTVSGLNAGNFLYFGGSSNTTRMIENITVEGIGDDATAYGYGFGFKRSKGIEVRNLGIMLFGDDGVGMDTDNFYNWIHNCDFFYGATGSDADQVKGDGSIDLKYNSTRITISFNHFWDSGKVMGIGGATGEDSSLLITYHHNWFDHADSRCPRLTNTNSHVYNNYYDGVAKYGVGTAKVTSVFVEANYFRGYQRPMTISGQGTDTYNSATGLYDLEGTFSGQVGGMTKAYNNKLDNCIKYVSSKQNATQFDAYEVDSRNEQIPATVTAVTGGYVYNNFDTDTSFYTYTPESPDEAKASVIAYAGRMNGGDFKWTFDNAVDDYNSDVNTALKNAIVNYVSSLVGVQGIDNLSTGVVTNNRANPTTFYLNQNYPNPFNPTTTIAYTIEQRGMVSLKVYDVLGRLVSTLVNEQKAAGTYSVSFNAAKLSSGVYFYQLHANRFTSVKTMLLVK